MQAAAPAFPSAAIPCSGGGRNALISAMWARSGVACPAAQLRRYIEGRSRQNLLKRMTCVMKLRYLMVVALLPVFAACSKPDKTEPTESTPVPAEVVASVTPASVPEDRKGVV